jgi:DNA primase
VATAMRFTDYFLDEIRARVPVSEVVRRRVTLKKQGREWRGLSPFNKERTPSFFVNDQKGFYHDFSSGKSGDQFTFLIETEGLTFPEAVERLAAMAGLPLPKSTSEDERREQRRKSLYEVAELAAKFFEGKLAATAGAKARGYLADRGIQTATQLEFRFGYAPPDRYALKEHLGSQGIPVEDMIEVGLLIAGEDVSIPYDRFRDRIIIPIHDQRGRVVGFGGRTTRKDVEPKYLNSPETPLFHKGSTVFNFHRARQPAHDIGSVVVVEGYLDAIAIYQAGMKSVVATMGTAFTEEQIQLLWRLSEEPIVCFDGDKAGVSAAHRVIDRILPELRVGRSFRFAFLPQGQDPDDVIRTSGVEVFRGHLKGSLGLWDMLWERETAIARIDTPDGRAVLEKRLYDLVRTIRDPIVGKSYYRTCRVQLSDLFWQHDRNRQKPLAGRFVKEQIKPPKEGNRYRIQVILLGLLVQYPEYIDLKHEQVASIDFDPQLEAFRRGLYNLLIDHGEISVDLIYRELKADFYEVLEIVHGEGKGKVPCGYNLKLNFPIVEVFPPNNFIEDCIEHFVDIIHLGQLEHDLRYTASIMLEENLTEDRHSQIINLRREAHVIDERIKVRELQLADEAQELRRVYKPDPRLQIPIAA